MNKSIKAFRDRVVSEGVLKIQLLFSKYINKFYNERIASHVSRVQTQRVRL